MHKINKTRSLINDAKGKKNKTCKRCAYSNIARAGDPKLQRSLAVMFTASESPEGSRRAGRTFHGNHGKNWREREIGAVDRRLAGGRAKDIAHRFACGRPSGRRLCTGLVEPRRGRRVSPGGRVELVQAQGPRATPGHPPSLSHLQWPPAFPVALRTPPHSAFRFSVASRSHLSLPRASTAAPGLVLFPSLSLTLSRSSQFPLSPAFPAFPTTFICWIWVRFCLKDQGAFVPTGSTPACRTLYASNVFLVAGVNARCCFVA